jgi:hypothetical protein
MNAHTPGPWFVADEDHIRAPYPNHAPGISIARLTCFGAHDVHMAKEANAHLISSAPDLLAALENAANVLAALATGQLAKVFKDSPALIQAREAIAKAKGGA